MSDGEDFDNETDFGRMKQPKRQPAPTAFEAIRRENEQGGEYWSARDLAKVLDYKRWDKFKNAIQKAEIACQNSNQAVANHFDQVVKMVKIGSGAERKIEDVNLSRYACYLVVENADPGKPIVALGQTYFATQARKAELQEEGRRIWVYDQLAEQTYSLRGTLSGQAGVIRARDFAIFQDYGYMGLYDGETAANIHKRKNLKPNQSIVDHMSRSELAANWFRASQAEDAIATKGVISQEEANKIHYHAGKITRKAISEISGAMPEELPSPTNNIQIAKKRQKSIEKLLKAAEEDLDIE